MDAGEVITASLTGVLVVITGIYAWLNHRMVQEMEAARSLTVLPHLALRWHSVGPDVSFVRVASVGVGPALDVEVTLRFVPREGSNAPELRRQIQVSLMSPGDYHDAMPTKDMHGPLMRMPELETAYERVELRGTARDMTGVAHAVDDVLPDIAAWRRAVQEAVLHWEQPDAEKRLAKELVTQLEKPFGKLTKAVDGLRREMRPAEESELGRQPAAATPPEPPAGQA